ncbi:MAG: Short-chain-enoyl-CoA hydratase [Turneriella sp.]|nr:Short-chain-enoyl-CoA hydratase [Turneriella sp.]
MAYKFLKTENKTITLKSGKEASFTWVTIDAPPLNALSSQVFHDLGACIDALEKSKTHVAIVTGAGKAFVAGADISEMKGMQQDAAKKYSLLGHKTFSRIENSPVIFIAAVNGFALGGGLELALSCDIRIFSQDAQAGLPEASLGLIPGFGGTQRLSRLVGESAAKYLTLTTERIQAADALRLNLANKLTPPDALYGECEAVAQKILSLGPNATQTIKRVIRHGADMPLKDALNFEADEFSKLFTSSEAHEGLSAFLEKRPAKF